MKISVIIPTLNAEKYIAKLVLSLKKQTLAYAELIIIDSSSRDNTADIARNLGCSITIVEKNSFDHGGTRNLGAGLSSGDVLVFMTQDAVPADNKCLERLVEPLKKTEIAASFGRQVAMEDAFPAEKFARLFNYPETAVVKGKEDLPRLGIKTFFFSNVCSAVRRREFEMVGRFPDRIIMNEDMVLAARLILNGYKVAYVPEAAVLHSHNYSIFQQFRRYFDIGASFSMNKWILEYAGAEGEGLRFTRQLLAYLLRHGHYRWIPHVLGLTVAKYAGYRLGLVEEKLPAGIKRVFSLHRDYWR